jgi:hypothetical protein
MSTIAEVQEMIGGEWAGLESQWEMTRQKWRDSVAEYFEREYWGELADEVPRLLQAMEDLNDMLNHALSRTEY